MSDNTTKAGPSIADSVEEVQGVFATDAAMQDAIAQLSLAGFDRADFSLPHTNGPTAEATPNQGADMPMTDTDMRQTRTMGTSMAGTIGAFAAAGATIATGGAAAIAIAAAAAVGAGSALAANAVGNAADAAQTEGRDHAAAAGTLVLAVHTATPEKRETAVRIMAECGATRYEAVERTDGVDDPAAMDSSSWTG